jgi:syntaxin-binding protein 1
MYVALNSRNFLRVCFNLVLVRILTDCINSQAYAQYNQNFPAPSSRPQGILMITDRSMDLFAPLVHEFTYQAMAHDLLPIIEGEKVMYKTIVNEGSPDQEEKEMEIGEKDKLWVDNRHMHMKDTITKLMGDFQKFIDENPHFTNSEGDATSLNAIKDMLAGLPQFQELKEAYSLHLTMAQECMNVFQGHKLPDVASVEQTLATGLDEDRRKPKNIADQLVRLLDDESISSSDRLRLIMMYIIFRNGVIQEDIVMLLAHSGLPVQDDPVIRNLDLLGARMTRALKENRPAPQPLFPPNTAPLTQEEEENALSRFEPMVKLMLEDATKGILDQSTFPYTKPPLDNGAELAAAQAQTSLRSAKPTWARNRGSTAESRQRIIVFVAGGATYSEARACYEVSRSSGRDIVLATSHMLTPSLFVQQVGDLSEDRRRLDLPVDRPKPKAPAHLFERNDPPKPVAPPAPRQGMGLPTNPVRGGPLPKSPSAPMPPGKSYDPRLVPTAQVASMSMADTPANGQAKLEKKSKHTKEESGDFKEKKKRHFFGSKK